MGVVWDWDFAFEILPEIAGGMLKTVLVTLVGIVIAVFLGLFLALGRRSSNKWISRPFAWFIEFVRSTPLLIQLFFLFYALPGVGFLPRPLRVLDAFVALAIGLGVHYACYASEAYRAGIDNVDKGQWEAATSLNLGTTDTWTRVILPQAIPRTLPPLGNYFVAMFKDAPIGSAITFAGVLFVSRALGSATFRFVEPITIAGILFLVVSIPAAMSVRLLERRVSYDN
jgi:polar amino acid transport system permease protein